MKIVIFGGGGGIGSSLAFNLVRSELPLEIVLVDSRPHMVTSHVMDLEDVLCYGRASEVRAGTAEEAADADVVVLTASVPLRLNDSRSSFLLDNAEIVDTIVAPWAGPEFRGVVLMMTNPVDAFVTRLHHHYGLPDTRVIGYTLNDSLRFRFGVAAAVGVSVRSVDAWVIGEHGEHQVPLYGRIKISGNPATLTEVQRASAQQYVDTWYRRHVALDSGRTSTWSSGLGAALMIEAMAKGSDEPFPANVVLGGQYGVRGVGLGVPALLGPTGVQGVVEWPLTDDEQQRFLAGATSVEAAVAELSTHLDGSSVTTLAQQPGV